MKYGHFKYSELYYIGSYKKCPISNFLGFE